MIVTFGITIVGFLAAGFVGYIRLDFYHLLISEINQPSISNSKLLDVLSFVLAIHEGQIMTLVIRCILIPIVLQSFTRLCLVYILSKESVSALRIRLYSEIRIISLLSLDLEKTMSGFLLGVVFWFVLLGTGTLYVGIRKNDISMAIPAFTISCLGVVIIQTLFWFGCSFNMFSTILLHKWKNDKNWYTKGVASKAFLKRVLKSLPAISMPAGTVGIIDNEIKMNYMNGLLQNITSTVLTLKDIL